jgi:hypothetical protein
MKTEISCKQCSKSFTSSVYLVEKRDKKYCSWLCYRTSKLGSVGANKGKHWEMSDEGRQGHVGKIGGRIGKTNPPAMIQKISSSRKGKSIGEDHYNWKGGVTTQNRIERVKFGREMQSKIFKRDNYTCQICDQYSGYLQVDHIKSWKDYPELRFESSNCRTLCMACHYYITFKRKMPLGIVWGHNLSRGIK